MAGTSVTVSTARADAFGNDRGTDDGIAEVRLDGVPCAGSTCELTRAGTARITATIGSIVGTADVEVSPAATDTVSVTLDDASIVANGTATTTARIRSTDVFGNRTATPTSSMSLTATPATGAPAIGTLAADGTGGWAATVTSSTTLGTWTLTATDATTDPDTSGTAPLRQRADVGSVVAFTSAVPSLVANGVDATDVDLRVTDATGHPIESAAPTVVASGAQVLSSVVDRGDGRYRVRVTSSTVAGDAVLTASLAGTGAATLALMQVPGAPARVELASSLASIVADGASSASITAVVRDAHGNAVTGAGADVVWSVDANATIVAAGARVGATSIATLTSSTAGTATVRAVASGIVATVPVLVTAKPASQVVPPPVPPAITPAAVAKIVSIPAAAFAFVPGAPDRTTLPVTCPVAASNGCRGSVAVRAVGARGAVLASDWLDPVGLVFDDGCGGHADA